MAIASSLFVIALWMITIDASLICAGQAAQPMIKLDALPNYSPRHHPFQGGEKEVYRATWNGMIAVASAEITTQSAIVDGRPVYQVRVDARSSRALDFIWKMRDTIRSTFDAKAFAPAHFVFNQRENAKVIDTEAKFDPSAKRWAVNRQQAGKRSKIYQFDSNNTLDPITAIYLARSVDFKIGDKLYFKIFGGRYQYLIELLVETKEPIELLSGKTVEAFRIVPRIQNITKNGYAGRLYESLIWLSADERRVPVKLSSKNIFGTVSFELVQEQRMAQSTAGETKRSAS